MVTSYIHIIDKGSTVISPKNWHAKFNKAICGQPPSFIGQNLSQKQGPALTLARSSSAGLTSFSHMSCSAWEIDPVTLGGSNSSKSKPRAGSLHRLHQTDPQSHSRQTNEITWVTD